MSKSSPNPPPQSLFRWLAFLIVTLVTGGVLLGLPVAIQRILFSIMVLIALVIALPDIRASVQKFKNIQQALYQHHVTVYHRISFVVAIVLLGLSAYFYQARYIKEFWGFYLFLLSLPFLRFSFALIPSTVSPIPSTLVRINDVIRWRWIGISLVSMILLMMMNSPKSYIQPIHELLGLVNASPHSQMLLLGISLASLVHGFGGRLIPQRIVWQQQHTILLGIVLLGGGIRLWNLEYTLHMFVDEFFFLRDVIDLNSIPQQILYPTVAPTTDIFAYLQMQFVNLLGPSLMSFRLVTPLFIMLGLVVIYNLVRQLFTIRVALISTFLFAVLPVYIHFGRIGMNMVIDPIFGMLGFMYFLRGLQSHRLSDFAMAGIAFGLTHYFYEGGRVFLTLFFVCWLAWITIACRRDPIFRLPNTKQFLVFIFCFTVVTVPIYHTLMSYNLTLTQRLDATRSPDSMLSERVQEFLSDPNLGYIGAPIQRYVQTPAIDNFYQSDDAYVLPILVPFFLLGFGILLWRIRTLQGALFIWWALGIAVANGLISDYFSAPSPRYIIVYGVLMIITAGGIDMLWSVLTIWMSDRWHKRIQVGFLMCLGLLGIYQVNYYFNVIVPNFHDSVYKAHTVGSLRRPAYDDMILRAVTLPENTTVHVLTETSLPNNHRIDVPLFFQRSRDEFRIEYMNSNQLTEEYFKNLSPDQNQVFTFTASHAPSIIAMFSPYFEITKIEGTPFDIPAEVEMTFYFTSPLPNALRS